MHLIRSLDVTCKGKGKKEIYSIFFQVRGRSRAEVGVTAVSINGEDRDIVVIGTEAGAVFQGNLASELPLAAPEDGGGVVVSAGGVSGQELEWRDPVTVTFSAHKYLNELFLSTE